MSQWWWLNKLGENSNIIKWVSESNKEAVNSLWKLDKGEVSKNFENRLNNSARIWWWGDRWQEWVATDLYKTAEFLRINNKVQNLNELQKNVVQNESKKWNNQILNSEIVTDET